MTLKELPLKSGRAKDVLHPSGVYPQMESIFFCLSIQHAMRSGGNG